MSALHELAQAAGLSLHWIDWLGSHHTVADATLVRVLTALGHDCADDAACARATARLAAGSGGGRLPPMLVVRSGEAVDLGPIADPEARIWELQFEDGRAQRGVADPGDDGCCRFTPFAPIGYHRLTVAGRSVQLAVCPARGYTVEDATGGDSVWGLAVQLYGLRMAGDGGIGHFGALGALAEQAAASGADAIAV